MPAETKPGGGTHGPQRALDEGGPPGSKSSHKALLQLRPLLDGATKATEPGQVAPGIEAAVVVKEQN